jgi:hypothetical protein
MFQQIKDDIRAHWVEYALSFAVGFAVMSFVGS